MVVLYRCARGETRGRYGEMAQEFAATQQHELQQCERCQRQTLHFATYASERGMTCVVRSCLVCGNEYAEMGQKRIPVRVQQEGGTN